MSAPRIGRRERLAALHAQREAEAAAEEALGLPVGRPAAKRWLVVFPQPTPPAPTPPAAREEAVLRAGAKLAEQLEPLPGALSDIAAAVQRHCYRARDLELAHALEALRARTWELQVAVRNLRDASGAERRGT